MLRYLNHWRFAYEHRKPARNQRTSLKGLKLKNNNLLNIIITYYCNKKLTQESASPVIAHSPQIVKLWKDRDFATQTNVQWHECRGTKLCANITCWLSLLPLLFLHSTGFEGHKLIHLCWFKLLQGVSWKVLPWCSMGTIKRDAY